MAISNRETQIGWRVVACALATVLWAILFAMLCWVVQSVGELKAQVAVLNNVVHIGTSHSSEASLIKIYKP
jgi:hypothetical protein